MPSIGLHVISDVIQSLKLLKTTFVVLSLYVKRMSRQESAISIQKITIWSKSLGMLCIN